MDIRNHGIASRNLSTERLYNGIKLPDVWPPRNVDPMTDDVIKVPYLLSEEEGGYSPKVIDVSVGRQLFVDDFLVEETDLKVVYHKAKKCEKNPLLVPETCEELLKDFGVGLSAGAVWYDMQDEKYKMWYDIAFNWGLGYAESTDGINWTRVKCTVKGDNVILDNVTKDGTCAVFIDYDADKSEKYKMFMQSFFNHQKLIDGEHFVPVNSNDDNNYAHTLFVSHNGIDWRQVGGFSDGVCGDASSAFYNAFTKKWVNSIRTYCNTWYDGKERKGRVRYYSECDNFEDLLHWTRDGAVFWLKCDKNDRPDPDIGFAPQMYNMNAIAYESIMYGGWQIWKGPENNITSKTKEPKITEIIASYSRDGFYYDRPEREPIIAASRVDGAWDKGYLFAAPASLVVLDDELRIYYSGFSGYKGTVKNEHGCQQIGMAILRRDGFASMEGVGTLLTRRLTVDNKKYLFVNIDAPEHCFKAEILDAEGNTVKGYSFEDCVAIGGDSTCKQITWKGGNDLSFLNGNEFKIRFYMEREGKLYSFWLSDSLNGRSGGALGAGYAGKNLK